MKINKFLSVAIGLLESREQCPSSRTASVVHNSIIALEDYLKEKGHYYTPPSSKVLSYGFLDITVTDQMLNPIISEIKCYPMSTGETLDSFNKVNNRIDFIRSYTCPNGHATIKLPVYHDSGTQYLIEISKGSQYQILSLQTTISSNKHTTLTHVLDSFISLKDIGWYAGDLHHHSIYSSPTYGGTDAVVETPLEVAYSMQAAGLDFGSLSDHHNTLNHPQWRETSSNNFLPIVSKEISTTNGHILSLNVDSDVIYRIPNDEERTEAYLRQEFIRTTNEIKTLGGLAQINHPRDLSPAISLSPKFTDMVEIFDTMEIWNGSNPMSHGTTNHAALMFWLELLEEGCFIPATTGSDTHNTRVDDYHQVFDYISWIINTSQTFIEELPVELKSELAYLSKLFSQTAPFLEKWIENSLGSGCVRTFVHLLSSPTPECIVDALKKGNSFLTNGPILMVSIKDCLPGDTILLDEDDIPKIIVKLYSNKPLKHLYIITNGHQKKLLSLQNTASFDAHYYDYSLVIDDFNYTSIKWLLFIAADDCCSLAITNPFFIRR